MKSFATAALLGAVTLFTPVSAHAATNCVFSYVGNSMILRNDCTTDEGFTIPAGYNFAGSTKVITVVDPVDGNFRGPVLKNAGTTAVIKSVIIQGTLLNVCNEGDDKVAGLLYDGSAGLIDRVNVSLGKGADSTCQEGTGVIVRNTRLTTVPAVTIKASKYLNNQFVGLHLEGRVNVRVDSNEITGTTANPAMTQNGIEIVDGAIANVLKNNVYNFSRPYRAVGQSIGIYLRRPGVGTRIDNNFVKANDYGIYVEDSPETLAIVNNRVVNSLFDGILLEGKLNAPITKVSLQTNDASKSKLSGIHLRDPYGVVTGNLVKYNITTRSNQFGINVEANKNTIDRNTSSDNKVLDISNTGPLNLFRNNLCNTHSGPPVSCTPAPPLVP